MPRDGLTQRVLAMVYSAGCLAIQHIYALLGARTEGEKERVRNILKWLVKTGRLERPSKGVYCIPGTTTQPKTQQKP